MEICQGTELCSASANNMLLTDDRRGKDYNNFYSYFYVSGFGCKLSVNRYSAAYKTKWYTVFSIKPEKFPEGFSRFYTFSLMDCKGNECYISKGSIRKGTNQILMTVFDEQLPPLNRSFRFSWYDNEITKIDKDIQVDSDNKVIDQSVQTEKPKFLPSKDASLIKTDIKVIDRSVQTEEPKSVPSKDKSMFKTEESALLLETLSKDFEHLYEEKVDTDCLLKVGEQQFPVHRQVLVARSTVFEAMFRHDTLESRCGIVDIPDIEADVMSDVLFYVYTGKIRNLTSVSAVSIYVAADKYALIELRDKCRDCLLNCLTKENFSDAAVLAHTHGETELENKVIFFIEERLEELMDNEKWKSFLKDKPVLASKLLCSALMANKVKIKMSPQ